MTKFLTDGSRSNPNPKLGNEKLDDPHFDSELVVSQRGEATNADLILTLKIFFSAATTVGGSKIRTYQDADMRDFPILNWGASDDFAGWCKKACRLAEKTWNEKLWLQTPVDFPGLDYPESDPTHRPNIHCGFRCRVASSVTEAHCKVTVVLLDPDRLESQGLGDFHSHFVLWDDRDILEWPFGFKGGHTKQVTCCHEVGHLLGLHHIGELQSVKGCFMGSQLPWGPKNACYAAGDASFANNIMGLGMDVTADNALPWQREICKYVNEQLSGQYHHPALWKASATRIAPQAAFKPNANIKPAIKEPPTRGIFRGSI